MIFSKLRGFTGYGSTGNRQQIWRILSSKVAKVVATTIVAFLVAWLWIRGFRLSYFYHNGFSGSSSPLAALDDTTAPNYQLDQQLPIGKGRLHLLIPATSTNSELCKLLLSAQILGYPTPVLINYGDHEATDGYVQHLAKVEGILRYLEKLEASDEYQEDLVLIIDGYDIWFQLRPDVLLKRFFAINAAANARTIERYGEQIFVEQEMYQSVVFGPDKLCWPVDFSRPACWAVPESTMSYSAFGPVYDRENRDKNPPKWLNSGTILGTVKDLVNIFNATLEAIHFNHVTDSDQFYFANLFGDQEYQRLLNRPDLLEVAKNRVYYDHEDPNNNTLIRTEPITFGRRTEYHIGIDYDSTMFQTLAFWKGQLAWTRQTDSWSPPADAHHDPVNPWDINISEDILASRPPFESLDAGLNNINSTPAGWESVELGYNVLTHQHPVLLHVTGNPAEKFFRKYWWRRMWFQKKAAELRVATHSLDERLISKEPIANLLWYNAEPVEDAEEIVDGGKGGAWTDRRGWLSWRRLCKATEEVLFQPGDDEAYHPTKIQKHEPLIPKPRPPDPPPSQDGVVPESEPVAEQVPQEGAFPFEGQPQEAAAGVSPAGAAEGLAGQEFQQRQAAQPGEQ
ncbi:hypothetical protein CB0940_04800 [Cercospora beticola]|uniref:Uncharacterized protein n=1 Tax=Cercospora beticola TaxID=122368 RepID=A0A2G5HKH8_CERBT|nr:hypothetical protein CB0940_04800 [Cercospora beticola]PIA93040.1 hypothetical protein CB0940_04800 [Cercospora beticola]WPB02072.1 hypothetical protein RHO25_006706 [Cercospora beticola]